LRLWSTFGITSQGARDGNASDKPHEKASTLRFAGFLLLMLLVANSPALGYINGSPLNLVKLFDVPPEAQSEGRTGFVRVYRLIS
jgi:hypothetical protein